MRAPLPTPDLDVIAAQLLSTPGIDRLRTLSPAFAAVADDMIRTILDEAARFAEARISPFNEVGDRAGAKLVAGRVTSAQGHAALWRAYVEQGWPTLEHPEALGGQGLPRVMATAVQEIFDRACPAFGMLGVAQRAAVRLIGQYGDPALRKEWLPRLVSGEWGATICISEAGAGSDVARIATSAHLGDDGWRVTGEKMWISFGDHDLTERIGHCVLARTPGGASGLSLFFVPDRIEDEVGGIVRNHVFVRRIEEKLGLHASPTCALGFEGAGAWLLGEAGNGLRQMFAMITSMRLAVGAQGLGIASGSADTAWQYAGQRRQGGSGALPVPIIEHPDVQRELAGQAAEVQVLRGLLYALAVQADLAVHETDEARRGDAGALSQWLLPIVKTLGADSAFRVSDSALQVLGGAGYTREWPIEQNLRDARVLSVFEGTTGIQALDLLERRLLRGDRRGFLVFMHAGREAASKLDARNPLNPGNPLNLCLDLFADAVDSIVGESSGPRRLAVATPLLRLATLAAGGWTAARLALMPEDTPAQRRLAASADYFLRDLDHRATMLHAAVLSSDASLRRFVASTASA